MTTFLNQYPVLIPFIAILAAEALKALIDRIRRRGSVRFLNPGGMPSGHSAFTASVVVVVAMKEGVGSTLFALASVLAVVVMFDAINVRQQVGLHAKLINRLHKEGRLEESIGHTHPEVIAGALFGGIVSYLLMGGV